MFHIFRRYSKTIVTVVVSLIIPAFVFWGVGSAIRARIASHAGKVWGRSVTLKEFNSSFSAIENRMMLIYGKAYANLSKFLDFHSLAWDRLIFLEEAKRKGVIVTRRELIQTIKNVPYFQYEKKFSKERYEAILQRFFRITPTQFEQREKNNLMIMKRKNQIVETVFASRYELHDEYRLKEDKVKVHFVQFDFKEHLPPVESIKESELKSFFHQNSREFLLPLQRKIVYFNILSKNEAVSPFSLKDAQAYYQSHQNSFEVKPKKNLSKDKNQKDSSKDDKKQAKVVKPFADVQSEILYRLKNEAQMNAAKDKAVLISEALLDNMDIKEIETSYKVRSMRTPFFTRSGDASRERKNLVPYRVRSSAFELKVGESGDIITSSDGFYVLKVLEEKAPYVPPFEEIQEKVMDQFRKDKSENFSFLKANQMRTEILKIMKKDKTSFVVASKTKGLNIQSLNPFSRSGRVSEFYPKTNEFIDTVFSLKTGEVSYPFLSSKGCSLISIEQYLPVSAKQIAKESLSDTFLKEIESKKRSRIYEGWSTVMRSKAHLKKNPRYFK